MANREHKAHPKSKRLRSTRREDGLQRFSRCIVKSPCPVMSAVLAVESYSYSVRSPVLVRLETNLDAALHLDPDVTV